MSCVSSYRLLSLHNPGENPRYIASMSVEMKKPLSFSLCVKDGTQINDLLIVTVNHYPDVNVLRTGMGNKCQQTHGAYVMDHHGNGRLLKHPGKLHTVAMPPAQPTLSPPPATSFGTGDVNLLRAYHLAMSRTGDMSFRRSDTGNCDICLIWTDESLATTRREEDYAAVIESQLQSITKQMASDLIGWNVSFVCISSAKCSGEAGPLERMLCANGVRCYKSYQSFSDDLFGIEINTHGTTSQLCVQLSHNQSPHTCLAINSGQHFDTYLSSITPLASENLPKSDNAVTLSETSDPMDTAVNASVLKRINLTAELRASPATHLQVVFLSDHPDISRTSTDITFSLGRRMDGAVSIAPLQTVVQCHADIRSVLNTLVDIRNDTVAHGTYADAFVNMSKAATDWDIVMRDVLPGMDQDDQSILLHVVGEQFLRVGAMLHGPVNRILSYQHARTRAAETLAKPTLYPNIPRIVQKQGRQRSLTLMT